MSHRAIVTIPEDIFPMPENHEREIAWILAKHYGCAVEFLKPIDAYKTKTADIVMNGVMWEIKSPRGDSKDNTVKSQFKKASRQSRSMVIDGRRTKLEDTFIKRQIQLKINSTSRLRKIIFITKSKQVIEFFK